MAIRLNVQRSADGGATWQAHATGVLAPYTGTIATPGTWQVRAQSYDDSDSSPPSPWCTPVTYTVTPATVAPVWVLEGELSINGGAFVPAFDRLDARRVRIDLSPYADNDTVGLRVRAWDLTDPAAAPSAWSATRTITVDQPAPAPVTAIASLPPARGISAAEQSRITARDVVVLHQLLIEDEDGVLRDMSALNGEDHVVAARWGQDPDAPVMTATFELLREVERADGTVQSLAPFMEGSSLNVRGSDGTYSPLVQKGRRAVWNTAELAPGQAVTAADWALVWEGYLDDPEVARSVITVTGRSSSSRLQDAHIMQARPYGTEAGEAIATVMRRKMADNGVGSAPLAVVGNPDFFLRPTEQPAGPSVMDALVTDALSNGWLLRDRFTGRTTQQLAFYAPPRAALTAATPATWVLGPDDYEEVESFRTDSDGVRGGVRIPFIDRATGLPDVREAKDDDTLARFPGSWMQLAYDLTKNIDSGAEAQALADRVLADVKDPFATAQIRTVYLWAVELGDVVELVPNGVHHDTPQKLMVVKIEHEVSRTEKRTTLWLRGTPMGAYRLWLDREAPVVADVPVQTAIEKVTVLNATKTTVTVRPDPVARRAGVVTGQLPDVRLDTLSPGVTVLAGPPVGQLAPAGTVWTLSRPDDAPAQADFVSVLAGALPSRFPYTIPEVGAPVPGAPQLVLRVREVARVAGVSVTYRAEVAVPPGVTPPTAITLSASAPGVVVAIAGDADADGSVSLPAPTSDLATTTATADITVPLPGAPLFATTVEVLAADAANALAPAPWSTTITDTEGMRRAMAALGAGGMPVAPTQGILLEDFARANALSDWTQVSGPGTRQRIANGGAIGAGFLRAIGEVWLVGPKRPYDPASLLFLRVGYRVDLYGDTGVPSRFWAGLVGYDANGALVNLVGAATYLNSHYFATASEAIAFTSGAWVTRSGWIKGTTATPVQGPSTNPLAPRAMHSGVVAVAPILILNEGGALNASSEVDFVALEAYDAEAAKRLYTAINGAGDLNPGVGQFDGVTRLKLVVGRNKVRCLDGQSVVFDPPVANPPTVWCSGNGCIGSQPNASAWSGAYSASAPVWPELKAVNIDGAGFTADCKLWQRGTPTLVNDAMTPASASGLGAVLSYTMATGPSRDDTYALACTLSITSHYGADGNPAYASAFAELRLDYNDGTGWTTLPGVYGRSLYEEGGAGSVTQTFEISAEVSLAGVASGDMFRFRVHDVDPFADAVSISGGTMLYQVSSADIFTTATPSGSPGAEFFIDVEA